MRVVPKLCGALVLVVLAAACGGGGGSGGDSPTSPYNSPSGSNPGSTPVTPGANEVIATGDNVFNPATLTVTKGTTVTFTFQAVTHNVTFAAVTGAPANISNAANASAQRVFSTAGTFGYDCSLHPGMHGQVVVN